MDKNYVEKIILSLFFITHSLFCHPDIEKEYPELIPLFASKEFEKLSRNFSIEVTKDQKELIGAVNIQVGKNGIKRTIIFSDAVLDREKLTAEELKFVICHELGHINDPYLWTTGILPGLAWMGATGVAAGHGLYGLCKRSPYILLKTCKGAGLLIAGLAAVQYLSRQGEYFADEFGLKMTGNLDAAVSALEKRGIYRKEVKGEEMTLQALFYKLFASHPSFQNRIERLKKMKETNV